MENHYVQWENPPFLWSFSIAMLVYPRVICYIAIEHGPFIVDFPIKNGWIFQFAMIRYVCLPDNIAGWFKDLPYLGRYFLGMA